MELQVAGTRFGMLKTTFDDRDERPVDCNFVLPEYMPDIAAILKCRMRPVVQSHQISGDRVIAEGTVTLQLLYVDEERRCVRSYEHSLPFTSAFTVKDLKNGDAVTLSAQVNYVNCRATGPRQVDAHGAFSVRLVVCTDHDTELVCAAEGDDLYTRCCRMSASVLQGCGEKTVSLNEVLELGEHTAVALIRSEATAVVTDCRQMMGKVVIKGDVLLETVYVTDEQSGEVKRFCRRLPFSQIVDSQGITEDALCNCRARVTHCDMRAVADPAGENRLLSVSVKLAVSVQCYTVQQCTAVTDAFHTRYPLTMENCAVESHCLSFVRSDTVTLQMTQELPDGNIGDILDVWCEPLASACEADNGDTRLRGQVMVCMITRDGEGTLAYYERPADYESLLPDSADFVSADVMFTEANGLKNGDKLELRAQAVVHRVGEQAENHTVVTRIAAEENDPYTCDDMLTDCCLKVCAASAGESVWELARKEHVSPELLKEENELTEDVLPQDMLLLIPMR